MKKFTAMICTLALLTAFTGCNNSETSGSVPESGVSSPESMVGSSESTDSENSVPAPDGADNSISETDVETVKEKYSGEDRPVYDTKIIDLDFNGKDELLVLTSMANPKLFEVWEKSDDEMALKCSFGAGKVNFIDKISLNEGKIDGERVYLFSFAYDEGNNMNADEVLSAIRKTEDGYEVEHLISRGTITYPDVAEPFTKEFYRKGWDKGDIGWDQDYGDIAKEEYDRLYEEYTG